jgi:hypothetical protein
MPPRNAQAVELPHDQVPKTPGAYYFLVLEEGGAPIGMTHSCPCGCGGLSTIFFKNAPIDLGNRPTWSVEGTWPKVTLKPSIGITFGRPGPQHWHGYLENGIFVER